MLDDLDAHEQPSDRMRAEWKAFTRLEQPALQQDARIDDPRLPLEQNGFRQAGAIPESCLKQAFSQLGPEYPDLATADVPIIHHPLLPGLLVIPNLLPPAVQMSLLDRMVHRDLSNPQHQTNMHLHFELPYPEGEEKSFFSLAPDSASHFMPKDPSVHKPLSMKQVMQRRLHWVTLGGQYDWTNRVYPGEEPPRFPSDLSVFLETLFPETLAQAAIVNFYTPGDTMMMHRDVSEEVNKGLVSLSFGCECLFMIAPNSFLGDAPPESGSADPPKEYLLLKLRSGDAIYMTDEARYAWHGVPKVIKGSCPGYLSDWPAQDGKFDSWRGWMSNKRINLNVRQMKD
ncbi:hypothetical protein B0I35DRAFT_436248 [Stachybotrys elegans]|uniref:mRNA N(6)-methyladenine demethylase n=1 Tax=Stachybotrys elegans TaxID=80388 RepID=A0A8K0WPF6_9HYPO|nr:hypothetical protein B0I35DRAFT_436248 [Stachybotrys elegans]